jgi:hypothetical protein
MIPPNALRARFRRALVVTADRCGPVAAAVKVTAGAARAADAGSSGPSYAGAERAVGVMARVELRANIKKVGDDAPAIPAMKISNTSFRCVADPPLIA